MSLSVLLVNVANSDDLRSRLLKLNSELCITTWDPCQSRNPPDSALAFMRLSTSDDVAIAERMSNSSLWLVGLNDDVATEDERLFVDSGVCQFLSESCKDTELQLQLRNAERLAQLQVLLAQAQKLQSIGELAAGIAHEINTPIQYVGDNTRFLQQAFDDIEKVLSLAKEVAGPGENSEFDALADSLDQADVDYLAEEIPVAIGQTLEGVVRVTNIVRAMKEFAHPGAGNLTDTDLEKAINNTILVARNEWKYVAEIETDFDSRLPLVPCFPGELNQVLLNLIVNAAQAIGEKNGSTPESKGVIRISTKVIDGWAEIRIADSGGGIPPGNLEQIFQPFFTTKPAGQGTGQGLAIARSVITEKHQGELKVESQVGEGATFIVRIPLSLQREGNSEDEIELATLP